MQSLTRSSRFIVRSVPFRIISTSQPQRFAHGTYGNDQSGHPKDEDAPNPSEKLEHPGPEGDRSQSSSSSSSSGNVSSGSSSGSESKKSDKGFPAIHNPKSAAEKDDPEVRKHNEEMRQRNDRSVNQLSEDDNKVDPKFWKGDVGPK